MNEYANTANSSGLLKKYYDAAGKNDSMLDALKRRRDQLTDKILVPTKNKIEGTDIQQKQIEDEYL